VETVRRLKGVDMSRFALRVLAAASTLALSSAACGTTLPDQSATAWGSNQASLTVADSTATIQVLASGGCYGSYGKIDQPIPSGTFSLPGTYTQLTGVYPGSVQYSAQYLGTVAGRQMTLSISIPALQQILGPFSLTLGVVKTWPACLYP
jgi:hypothetical protein